MTEKAEPPAPVETVPAATEPVATPAPEPVSTKDTTCCRPASPAKLLTTAPRLALVLQPFPFPPYHLTTSFKHPNLENVSAAVCSSHVANANACAHQESRKLSYAEVCQRPAKDPLPAQPPSPSSSPAPEASQPLRELGVNKAEEPRAPANHNTGRGEKPGDSRPPREPLGSYRGGNGPARAAGAGVKGRERPRGPPPSRRFAPQGAIRRSGKEQNIPPRSPK